LACSSSINAAGFPAAGLAYSSSIPASASSYNKSLVGVRCRNDRIYTASIPQKVIISTSQTASPFIFVLPL
jgi:hypothetical protein